MPGDVAELVGQLGDSSLRVGGRDDEQNSALHHDWSVLGRVQSGLEREDGVDVLDDPGRRHGELGPGVGSASQTPQTWIIKYQVWLENSFSLP